MAAENESPAREPNTPSGRGRGRGGRGGRGRGRGGGRGGASNAVVAKTTATRGGRGGTRRGRAKNFSDSRVQAAYERQRDLKATYQAVAFALKPALQELAERNVDDMLRNPDMYKNTPEYPVVVKQLRDNFNDRMAKHRRRRDVDVKLAEDTLGHETYVIDREFENGLDELFETFYEAQENRLRILSSLQSRGLPVDIRDDQYEYKVISDQHLKNDFGIYEAYIDGHLVPYPSRVEGTDMWQRAQDDAAAAVITSHASSSTSGAPTPSGRGRGRGRGGIKRRAQESHDAPTPKRNTRGNNDALLGSLAPAKGLLASAAEVDIQPEGTPAEEESPSGSPEPVNMASAAHARLQGKLSAREKSPPLPKNVADPDEYGVRIYNQKPSFRDKAANNRILAPRLFDFEDIEIGFKDSTNDSTKGHTANKRGKYLNSPNSNGMHFDHYCNGYDFSDLPPSAFDKELVKRHGVHPEYGIFLPSSSNELQQPAPYIMPGKPVVFIANPSGRISHASRSYQRTMNHNRSVDAPWRSKIGSSFRRFCKLDEVDLEDVSVREYVLTEEELRAKSLRTAEAELAARPVPQEDAVSEEEDVEETMEPPAKGTMEPPADLSTLALAAIVVNSQESARAAAAAPPKPAKYDAVRDLFVSEPKPPPPAASPRTETANLNILADICNLEPRTPAQPGSRGEVLPQPVMAPAPAPGPAPAHPRSIFTYETRMSMQPEQDPGYQPGGYLQRTPQDHRNEAESASRYMMNNPPMPSYQPSRAPPHMANDPAPYSQSLQQPPPQQQQPPPMGADYKHAHHYSQLPPHQESSGYPTPSMYPDQREPIAQQGRPYDQGYGHRRMSGYGAEREPYGRSYWPSHQQQPPPVPSPSLPPVQQPQGPPPSQPYLPQPTNQSRTPFSHHASAEPLPPLRPPRGRTQSIQDDSMIDPAMRQPQQSNFGGQQFYQPGPSRSFQPGSYPPPPPEAQHPAYQRGPGDTMLPGLPSAGPSYMTSPPPPQAYGLPPGGSPTFSTLHLAQSPMGQSPSDTPGSIFRHRSTPSGSSSAAANDPSKYRKLQPAPIPAHRAWASKPELKTIPYDHKDTGGVAALPNSGPTQIRGWNVNQHRRRGRADKHVVGNAGGVGGGGPDPVNEREESR